jgi:sulfate transport system permease protein
VTHAAASPALAPSRGERVARAGAVAYVAVLVGIPLAALLAKGLEPGLGSLWRAVTAPAVTDALFLTLWTAALMAVINAVMGTAVAWVLVRYRFPGRSLLSALVDLPFAIPTLVAGVTLVLLFGPQEPSGRWLADRGFPIAFAAPGIVLALLFITLPLVTRAVEPVLMELDPAEEEAALTLGAGTWATFRRVLLPPLIPAVAYGSLQSFARAIAEFGSVVVISGNIPHRTLTAPVLIFGEVESGRPEVAAGVSLVLLVIALGLSLLTRGLRGLGRTHGD